MEEESVLRINDECQYSQDGDDIYTFLATEITIRKCKIEQKKKKAETLVCSIKELNNKLKHSEKQRMCLMKETEVISSQRALKATNIKEVIESRTSLELVLSDLINKVSCKKAEREEKNEMYKEAIKKSVEIRETYKAVYEEFPLAIKRRETANEMKKINIEIRKIKMDIEDIKYKEKLKRKITEKRHHMWAVNMAKAYFKIQEKKSENSLLQNKLSGLKKQYEDMKAGKSTSQWTSDKLAPIKYGLKPFQEFQTVIASLRSDTAQATLQPRGGRLFDWKNTLLFNYDSSFSFFKNTKKVIDEARISTDGSDSTNKLVSQHSNIFKTALQPQVEKVMELPSKTINESRNVSSEVKKCIDESVRLKRKIELEDEDPIQKQTKQLVQDTQKSLTVNQNERAKDTFKIKVANELVNENSNGIYEKRIIDHQKGNKYCNKEIIKSNDNLISSSRIKSLVMSLTVSNKNSCNDLIENQKHTFEPQKNFVSKAHAKDNSKQFLNYQPILQQENYSRGDVENDCDKCETQMDNVSMVMDPTSPPDLVPVENNSQSHSQKINSSNQISSQSTEFTSLEVDETTKLHYERAAKSPEFIYPMERQACKSHTTGAALEEEQQKITSQYFSSSPQSDLNTPTSPCQGDYQPMPYSPPANLVQNDLAYLTNVLSPPEANLEGFNFGKSTSIRDGQSDGTVEGGFTFNFMSGADKKSRPPASIFSLF